MTGSSSIATTLAATAQTSTRWASTKPLRTTITPMMPAATMATSLPSVTIVALVAGGVLSAMALLAIFQTASWALTALGLGALIAMALDPVVRVIRRRARCSRAVATLSIGVVMMVALAGPFIFLGPTAVDQTTDFADELPATIEELYSWPLVGARLEQWDAVWRAETFVDDLPSRFDADAIEPFAERAVGGVAAALIVLLTAVAVLLDGEAMVQRIRRRIPPCARLSTADSSWTIDIAEGRLFRAETISDHHFVGRSDWMYVRAIWLGCSKIIALCIDGSYISARVVWRGEV